MRPPCAERAKYLENQQDVRCLRGRKQAYRDGLSWSERGLRRRLRPRGPSAGPLARAWENANLPFSRRLPVHPFPANVQWINVARPITLRELRGKFVLLDFWTLGCINCMHIIPELRKLERAWPNELVVIGVHSAKFASERDTKNIKEAVLRYHVEHPVVNDSQFIIWNSFGIQAWPSLVLIDPAGYAVWGQSGEVTFEQVDAVLRRAVPFYRQNKLLDPRPLRFAPRPTSSQRHPCSFRARSSPTPAAKDY